MKAGSPSASESQLFHRTVKKFSFFIEILPYEDRELFCSFTLSHSDDKVAFFASTFGIAVRLGDLFKGIAFIYD